MSATGFIALKVWNDHRGDWGTLRTVTFGSPKEEAEAFDYVEGERRQWAQTLYPTTRMEIVREAYRSGRH